MHRTAGRMTAAAVASLLLIGAGCSDDDSGPEGAYTHTEEGTITLSDGGKGRWEQEGNDEAFEFEWEEKGEDAVVFTAEGEELEVKLEGGDLVLPPDAISGDEEVTFEAE